jgi:hypothetical protein
MKILFTILGFYVFLLQSISQGIVSPLDSLQFYGDAMFSLKLPSNKIFAESRFLELAERLIITDEDSTLLKFHPSFVMTESNDQAIKIVSWQIQIDTNDYHYCAYLFTKGQKPVFLKSIHRNLDKINYESFNQENWYGAMYYHFLPVLINGYYTVLGYRFSNEGYKYRVIELLKCEDGKIEFGSPLFRVAGTDGTEDFLYRKMISYSPSANIVVKYDEESKLILFDHVERFIDPKSGEVLRVPDGTFEAFELKDQYWDYIPYHKLQIIDTPPREKPVLGTGKKDLFGKDKKK